MARSHSDLISATAAVVREERVISVSQLGLVIRPNHPAVATAMMSLTITT